MATLFILPPDGSHIYTLRPLWWQDEKYSDGLTLVLEDLFGPQSLFYNSPHYINIKFELYHTLLVIVSFLFLRIEYET